MNDRFHENENVNHFCMKTEILHKIFRENVVEAILSEAIRYKGKPLLQTFWRISLLKTRNFLGNILGEIFF